MIAESVSVAGVVGGFVLAGRAGVVAVVVVGIAARGFALMVGAVMAGAVRALGGGWADWASVWIWSSRRGG